MKAAIFYGGKDIRLEETPLPVPGPGEVLCKVLSAGVCGSDLHLYRGQNPYGAREPHQRGHELAGEVVALGAEVSGLAIGQRVGIEAEHLLGCGRCRYCRRGEHHLCPQRGYRHGERQESHGFAEYDLCLATNCHPLPAHISCDAAALLDCYACGVHALNRVRLTPTDTIAILGTGAIGMTLGQVAKAYGIGRILMALDLMASGRLNASPLITTHFPLDQIQAAFAAAEDKRTSGAIKVMVHPNPGYCAVQPPSITSSLHQSYQRP